MKMGWRIWLLIIALLLSLLAIKPNFQSGVVVKSIDKNDSFFEQGLRQGEVITAINGKPIKNMEDYTKIIQETFSSQTEQRLSVVTKKNK